MVTTAVIGAPIIPIAIVGTIVASLQPVVLSIMLTLHVAVEAAMFPPAETLLMGAAMLPIEPVMTGVVPVFQAVVCATVPIAG